MEEAVNEILDTYTHKTIKNAVYKARAYDDEDLRDHFNNSCYNNECSMCLAFELGDHTLHKNLDFDEFTNKLEEAIKDK